MNARLEDSTTTITLALLVCCAALGAGCGADDGDPGGGGFVYQNQIFRDTVLISAAQSASLATPAFSWPALGEKHVVCAIFSERIQVAQNRITNADKAVWVWHTGLGQGREGNVLYGHGVPDASGKGNAQPAPLPPGSYYWAVWALDEAGQALASSVEKSLGVP